MFTFLLSLGWLGIVITLLWVAYQRLQAYKELPAMPAIGFDGPTLAVIVPARNEAHNIGRCLEGLLAQTYPASRLRILVVNDDSTDDTAAIVRRIAETDKRVELIDAGALPEGWLGKPHACWQGAQKASGAAWLCFVDADTVAAPALLASAVGFAEAEGLDMLSLQPHQEMVTLGEKVVLPEGFFLVLMAMDLRRINDPHHPDAAANGQFILIRRAAYDAVQGHSHSSVRSVILEDIALARRVKGAGRRLCLMGGTRLIRTRMYSSVRAIWNGLSNSAPEALGLSSPATLLAAIPVVMLGWLPVLLPIVTVAVTVASAVYDPDVLNVASAGVALLSTLLLSALHIALVRFFGLLWFYGVLFPLSYTALAAIMINGAVRRGLGRNTWKERRLS
jgi:chlorobactene glucosyltransferase